MSSIGDAFLHCEKIKMSKLFSTDEPERPSVLYKGSVLRRRRKKPLHPETIHDLIRAKVKAELPPTGWSWPHGWLIILWETSGKKHYRDLPANMTYMNAVKERDEEMEMGEYEKAWLIKKIEGKHESR